jgi:hypothetical protein
MPDVTPSDVTPSVSDLSAVPASDASAPPARAAGRIRISRGVRPARTAARCNVCGTGAGGPSASS